METKNRTTAEEFIAGLQNPESGGLFLTKNDLHSQIAALKINAIACGDEQEANRLWCAQTIAELQHCFTEAFAKLKSGAFYDAWCEFEHCEIALGNLSQHFSIDDSDSHRLQYIRLMVERWQSLYPYRFFASPELLKKRITCSVCGYRITPRANCGHKKRNLYNGEICFHIIEEMDVIAISLVENPVQRYSVLFLGNEDGTQRDHYDYSNVKFIADRVTSPFHEWNYERTTRLVAAAEVAHIPNDHHCPCLSGKHFGECCIDKQEFKIPHLQVTFAVPPPRDLPSLQLLF